jgi:hypothetical protein
MWQTKTDVLTKPNVVYVQIFGICRVGKHLGKSYYKPHFSACLPACPFVSMDLPEISFLIFTTVVDNS